MMESMDDPRPNAPRTAKDTIDATFRNGSMTAISVIVGFSLSFLTRWAGLPGLWNVSDLVGLTAIVFGIAFQIAALANLLLVKSLLLRNYNRAVRVFLIGLGLVATGVGFAITSDLAGHGQRLLGG